MEKVTDDIVGDNEPPKIDGDTKEELRIGIHHIGGDILIQFNRPVSNIRMSKKHAREFSSRLARAALK